MSAQRNRKKMFIKRMIDQQAPKKLNNSGNNARKEESKEAGAKKGEST